MFSDPWQNFYEIRHTLCNRSVYNEKFSKAVHECLTRNFFNVHFYHRRKACAHLQSNKKKELLSMKINLLFKENHNIIIQISKPLRLTPFPGILFVK